MEGLKSFTMVTSFVSIFNKELCNKIGIFIQKGLLESHILLNTAEF